MMPHGAGLVALAEGALLVAGGASIWAGGGDEDERESEGGCEQTSGYNEEVDVIEDDRRDALDEEKRSPPVEFAGIDVIDGGDSESIDKPESEQNPTNTEKGQEAANTEGEQTTASKLASRGAVSGSVAATEVARRAGIDRHAEAGLAEELHAKAYARKVGGSVVSDSTSVFTPDGGVDKIVMTPDGEKAIQSKHYGSEVGEAVLRRYDPDVDVLASTGGISDSVDPSNYDQEIITADDWLIRERVAVEGRRVKRGVLRGLQHSARSAAGIARRVAGGSKYALNQLLGGAKLARRFLSSAVTRAIGMFARQPRVTQGAAVVVVAGALWLLWRKRNGEYTRQDLKRWLAVVACIAVVVYAKRMWDNRR